MLTRKKVFLHVGVLKSGSTALQHNFFTCCPGIHYLGKPHAGMRGAAGLIRSITDLNEAEWRADLDVLRVRSAPLFETREDQVVISEEEFSTGSLRGRADRTIIAERLHLLFPHAAILVVLRSQLTALQSLYAYAMTLPGTRYVPFNAWMRELIDALPHGRGLQLFDYAGLVELYASRFGREKVHVLFQEDLRACYPAFISRLARILGVDAAAALSLPSGEVNVAQSRRWVWALKLRDRQPWIGRAIAALPRSARQALGNALHAGPPLDIRYSSENEAFVRDYYAGGNRRLQEVHGIDVRSRGYPL